MNLRGAKKRTETSPAVVAVDQQAKRICRKVEYPIFRVQEGHSPYANAALQSVFDDIYQCVHPANPANSICYPLGFWVFGRFHDLILEEDTLPEIVAAQLIEMAVQYPKRAFEVQSFFNSYRLQAVRSYKHFLRFWELVCHTLERRRQVDFFVASLFMNEIKDQNVLPIRIGSSAYFHWVPADYRVCYQWRRPFVTLVDGNLALQ